MKEKKCCKIAENSEICVKCFVGIDIRNKLIMKGLPEAEEYWNVLFCSNCGEIISRNCPNSKNYVGTI